jgi:hypothetical protein
LSQPPRKRSNQRRNTRPVKEAKPINFWQIAPPLPDVQPIIPGREATALVRSLGDPPLSGNSVVSGHYIAAVVERAAMLSRALATSVDLLGEPDTD